MAKRKRAKAAVDLAAAPTPERIAGADFRRVPTETAGALAYQMQDDCLLVTLYAAGALRARRDGEDQGRGAVRRHDAGMWLRTLYFEKACMAPVQVGGYGARKGTGELPEHVAWNQKAWHDTMRALGPTVAATLRRHIIDDEPISLSRAAELRRCLDLLADHRGM